MYRHPPGLRGFLIAIVLLGGALVAAFLLGAAAFWALESAAMAAGRLDGVPNWWLLLTTAAFLLPLLFFLGRTFPFLTDWYYLLPAIVFLLVFTVYPIVLTVYLAFTDYSGMRNGFPDRSTETAVVAVEGPRLTLAAEPRESLGCGESCVGQELELVGGGHRARFRVTAEAGRVLTLDRAPDFEPRYAYRVNAYHFIGFKNFVFIFKNASRALWPVFVWNVVFAAFTVFSTALVGLILGVLLNNKDLKLRNLYRTLLIISWALPGVISIQMWVALLNKQFGAVNRLLGLLGVYPIPWLLDPLWAKVAVLLVNLWLGFPYMMTATLGALSTIPDELYEAARVDGASGLDAFQFITLPLLKTAFVPILLASFAYNFNNFNIIYLLTGGGPAVEGQLSTAQATDILISWAYKTAFRAEGQSAYGLGAAISLVIFVLTVAISLVNFRVSGALREEGRR
ncbi:ABC transporter permease subunit [Oceanithermus sp.]